MYELERGGFRSGGSQTTTGNNTTSATSNVSTATGSTSTAGGWTSVGGGGASTPSTLDTATYVLAEDLCPTGFFCKGMMIVFGICCADIYALVFLSIHR